jgi:hypothetical protein
VVTSGGPYPHAAGPRVGKEPWLRLVSELTRSMGLRFQISGPPVLERSQEQEVSGPTGSYSRRLGRLE